MSKPVNVEDYISEITDAVRGYSVYTIITAAAIAIIGILAIRLVMRIVTKVISRSKLNIRMQSMLCGLIRFLVSLIVVVILCSYLGINMSSVVALLSVFSLGLTLAAEDILANLASGLVILSSHLFDVGDYIKVGDTEGTVKEIKLNHVRLLTLDGVLVMLPNRTLSSSEVQNFTHNGKRRISKKVTASYDSPTDNVKAACMEAMSEVPNILPDPAPVVYLTEYGTSSIEYTMCCWVKPADYITSNLALTEALRPAFERNHAEMSYDHLNVHIVEKS